MTGQVTLDGGATGLVKVDGLDAPMLYAATGHALAAILLPADGTAPSLSQTVWMPAAISRVTYDTASQIVHALGRTPDGTGWTVYVVEPRGNSVFADARLPFAPAAWATDVNPDLPATDREQLLVFGGDGSAASVDIGQHAFAWRLPGVIAGALMAGLLFLLARILFRRRSVAILAGLFGLLDGMFFVQQRIAMNDTYAAFFIVAAVTLFAAIWTGAWRWRGAFWVGMPIVGLLLGLGLASKWVALYALAAIGLLILVRSALGRVVVVLALGAGTAVLGYMAVSVPAGATSGGNLTFLAIMIGLTLVAAAVTVLHPIAWSVEEVRIAVAAPAAAGALVALAAIPLGLGSVALALALGCFGLAALAMGAFWLAGRLGFGPLAPPPAPDDPAALLEPPAPAPEGWLRPGWRWGLPVAWAGGSLLAIPAAVYVALYLPWVALGNRLTASWPPGNTGQTLLDLTKAMYDYHNNLRATHPAASPWWAWPLDLKPVWFFQQSFARVDVRRHLRRREPGHLVALDPGHRVRRLAGVSAPEPRAGAHLDRDRLHLALVGADRPRHVRVPLLRDAPVRDPRPLVLRGRAVARAVGPDLAAGPGWRGRGPSRPGRAVAGQGPALRDRRRREGRPGLPGVLRGRVPAVLPDGPGGGRHRRHRGGWRAAGLAARPAGPVDPGRRRLASKPRPRPAASW